MRLAGPLQSWGVDAKFDRRGTERAPTKSAVVGLLAAALGRRRNESIEDLCQLRFGVRIDQEGALLRDFHTARSEKSAYVTQRFYLSDAVFLAGVEGEERLIDDLSQALNEPVFPLFLGRRSCPPEGRLNLGVRKGCSLYEALRQEPLLVGVKTVESKKGNRSVRILLDDVEATPVSTVFFQRDVPVSYEHTYRKYGFRKITETSVMIQVPQVVEDENPTNHDAFAALGKE